jgi:hypothetical protein
MRQASVLSTQYGPAGSTISSTSRNLTDVDAATMLKRLLINSS